MHTVFTLLCFVVVIHWLIFPYPSGLLHWHCGNLTITPVPAKQPWWIWINTSCEFIMNDYITTTKQSTTKPCAYFLGYTVHQNDVIKLKYFPRHCTNPLCGEFTDYWQFPSQRPVTRSFDVFFDLGLDKRLIKQSRRRRFDTPSRSLWRHCDVKIHRLIKMTLVRKPD